jgi:hypothetical protein
MADDHDRYQHEPVDMKALARAREWREKRARRVIGIIGGLVLGALLVDLVLEYAGGAYLLFRSRDDDWDEVAIQNASGAGVESTVLFTARVNRQDADRLGKFLREAGVFSGTEPKSCALSRRPDGYVVSLFIHDGYLDDKDVIRQMDELRRSIASNVFEGKPVILQMCRRDVVNVGKRRHLNVVQELRD